MYKFYGSILLLLSLSSMQCSPSKNSVVQGKEIWHGRWQWEETQFVRRGGQSVTRPKDLGTEMEIELLADGQLKIYHNKQLVKTTTYEVQKEADELLFVPNLNTDLKPSVETGPLRCTADSLEIIGGYNDAGGNQLFRRVK